MYPALLNQTQTAPYQGAIQPMGNSMQPQYNMPQSYAHGGRPKRGKMVLAHMSRKEMDVLDHIQGKQERCPRSNLRSYSHLEELLKNPHILHKVHQHVEHHSHGGMAHNLGQGYSFAHGGQVSAANGIHGDTELAMIGPHTHRAFDHLARMHGYSAGDLVNPHDGRPQYWSLGNTLGGIYNAVAGIPNTIKQGAEGLYNTGKQGAESLYNTGKQGVNDIYNFGKQGVEGAGNLISQGANDLYNTGRQGMNEAYKGIQGAGNLLSQGAHGAYDLGKRGVQYAKDHPEILQTIGSVGNAMIPAATKAGQQAASERYGPEAGALVGVLGGLAGKGSEYLSHYGKKPDDKTPSTANDLGNAAAHGFAAGYNQWGQPMPTTGGGEGEGGPGSIVPPRGPATAGQSVGAALSRAGSMFPGSIGGMTSGIGSGMMRQDGPGRMLSSGAYGAVQGSQGQSAVGDAIRNMMGGHRNGQSAPNHTNYGQGSALRILNAGHIQHGNRTDEVD